MKNRENYLSYLNLLNEVSRDYETMRVLRFNIEQKLIKPDTVTCVSDFRIIEMVMFLKGRNQKN